MHNLKIVFCRKKNKYHNSKTLSRRKDDTSSSLTITKDPKTIIKNWQCDEKGICHKHDNDNNITHDWSNIKYYEEFDDSDEIDIISECNYQKIPVARSLKYSDFLKRAKPFDCIFFRGDTKVSKFIRFMQKITRGGWCTFSHVGMIVDTTVLRLEGMNDGEKYVLESVIGGIIPSFDSVYNISGEAQRGVQIRSLEEQILAPENKNGLFFWAPLSKKNREKIEKIPMANRKTDIIKLIGIKYPLNLVNFINAIKPGSTVSSILEPLEGTTNSTFFCSEMVARLYQIWCLIDPHINTRNIFPVDFWSNKNIPVLFSELIPLGCHELFNR